MSIDWRRVKDDEAYHREVFGSLLQTYQDEIWRYCVSRCGDMMGEEVALEALDTAFTALPAYRQESPLRTWLFGIAKYKCMHAFRNRARRRLVTETFLADIRSQVHAEAPRTPEDVLVGTEARTYLATGLARLAETDRLILILSYYKELTIPELAEVFGKSEAAIRKQRLRALQRLKELYHGLTG